MKKIKWLIAILLLQAVNAFSQHVYQIRADSVRIYNICDTAELIIENRTRGVAGFLYNKGNGRTEFRRVRLETIGNSQIAISGQDTLDISNLSGLRAGVDTIYRNGDSLVYVKNGLAHAIFAPASGGGGGATIYTADGTLTGNRTVSGASTYGLSLNNLTNYSVVAGQAGMKIRGADSVISFSTWGNNPDNNRDLVVKKGNVSVGRIGDNTAGINDSIWNVVEVGITKTNAGVPDTGILMMRDKRIPSSVSKSYKITFESNMDVYSFKRPAIWAESVWPFSPPTLNLQGTVQIVPSMGTSSILGFSSDISQSATTYFSINAGSDGTRLLHEVPGKPLHILTSLASGNSLQLSSNRLILGSQGKNINLVGYGSSFNADSILTTNSSGDLIFTSRNLTTGALTQPQNNISGGMLQYYHAVVKVTSLAEPVALPTASVCLGRVYEIINYNTGGNVTISPVEIYGIVSTAIPNNTTWRVQSDGTKWILLSRSN